MLEANITFYRTEVTSYFTDVDKYKSTYKIIIYYYKYYNSN